MDIYDAQRRRTFASGANHKEGLKNSTKRQAYNYLLNSATNSEIEIYKIDTTTNEHDLKLDKTKTVIVSDKENFHKRIVLYMPDDGEKIGAYLKHDNKFYLTTDESDVDVYPQGYVEHCNYHLEFKIGEPTRVQTGTDVRGRPIYEYIHETIKLPVVASSKIYSVLDNSQMPTPEGSILVKLQYHPDINVKVNDEFSIHEDKVKVTTVSYDDIYFDDNGKKYGYYTLRTQKDVGVNGQ